MPLERSRNHSNPGKTLQREWDPLLLGLNQVPSPKGPGLFKEMQKSVRSVSKLSCGLPEETNPTRSCGILLCPILASLEPEHLEPESPISPPMLLNSPMHDSYFSAYLAQSDFGLKTSCHKGLHFPIARKPTLPASDFAQSQLRYLCAQKPRLCDHWEIQNTLTSAPDANLRSSTFACQWCFILLIKAWFWIWLTCSNVLLVFSAMLQRFWGVLKNTDMVQTWAKLVAILSPCLRALHLPKALYKSNLSCS